MKIISWNVNGLRAAVRKGFLEWLHQEDAEIIGLQEVRALPEQLKEKTRAPEGWQTHFCCAEKKGYSGVALYSRSPFDQVHSQVGIEHFDSEGRIQIATVGALTLVNAYFPNGSGKNRDLSRIPYKLEFYRYLRDRFQEGLDRGERILVIGDFNTAHQEIDLARPQSNHKTSGFRPEEREEFDQWIQSGWTDTFRHFCSQPDRYTWWSQRKGVRERNVGWRIDYVLASPGAMEFVQSADIHHHVLGSDHCPISVVVDPAITSL